MSRRLKSCRLVYLLMIAVTLPPSTLAAAELPFATATVESRDMAQRYNLDGRIEAVRQATVSSETSGRVTEINFDVGDRVQEGQVLMRITQAEQQAGLTAARAAVFEAEARLTEAEAEFQRVKDVFAKNLVAKSAMDKASADLKSAQQRLEAAKANLKSATERLKYTTIAAPYSGVVVRRLVEMGEAVSPGMPVMEGLSLEPLRVVAQVPQSLQARLRGEPEITVHFPYQDIADIHVLELKLSPRADDPAASFLMRGELPQDTQGVFPGMLVKVSFTAGNVARLLIPKQAVVRRSELTAVYVVDGQKVSLRQVRAGREEDGDVVVLAGLAAGETIALDPVRAGIYLKESR